MTVDKEVWDFDNLCPPVCSRICPVVNSLTELATQVQPIESTTFENFSIICTNKPYWFSHKMIPKGLRLGRPMQYCNYTHFLDLAF